MICTQASPGEEILRKQGYLGWATGLRTPMTTAPRGEGGRGLQLILGILRSEWVGGNPQSSEVSAISE